ncbi:MAG: Protein-export membrane protein SecG [Chlamydiae bacterium]|nr:Protein-export membrane protein SecG [Chlamydiota bacterium]
MILFFFSIFLFVLVCVMLAGVIMVQEGKGGGLGASFGGDSGDSLFGTSTADVLKRFTGWLAVIFLIGCVMLSLWTEVLGRNGSGSTPYDTEYFE